MTRYVIPRGVGLLPWGVMFSALLLLLLPSVQGKARGGGSVGSTSDVTDPPEPPTRYLLVEYTWIHILLWTVGVGLIVGILVSLLLIKICLYSRDKKTYHLQQQVMGRKLKVLDVPPMPGVDDLVVSSQAVGY